MTLDNQRRRLLKYGGVVAGTALAGCTGGDGGDGMEVEDGGDGSGGDGSDGADGSDGDDELSGPIQIYGIDQFEDRASGEGFREEYGVDIQTTELLGGENAGRYIREHNSDVHEADIVHGFDENFAPITLHEDDLVADPELPNRDDVWDPEYEEYLGEEILENPEDAAKMVPLGGFLSCFSYNTNLVDDPPTSYWDLLDDRWENEIIMLAYNVDGFWDHIAREHDEETADEWIVQLDELNPQYMEGSPLQALESVGAGERAILPDSFVAHNEFYKEQGLPIDWTWGEFIWQQWWGLMLMERAPNFEAGKAFCQYMASEEGQERFSQLFGGCQPAHQDLPHGNSNAEQEMQDYDGNIRPQAQWPEREEYAEQRVEELIGV